MKRYIVRRILQLIPVLFGISIAVFIILRLIPGGFASGMLGIDSTPELIAQVNRRYGLDQPVLTQYLTWIGGVLHGDFGISFRSGAPILPEILTRFQVTAELTVMAAVISLVIAIPLGMVAAVKHNSFWDRVIRVVALLGVSVPAFALSILLILGLSFGFDYYPELNYVSLFENPLANLKIMFLPALVLGLGMSGAVMRMTRSSMLEVLRQDFIKTVRAKGASERIAVFRHALRSSLIPIMTLSGLQIGSLLGGAVVVEQIFSLPGLGLMTLTGINNRDYPVVQGCVLFIAFVYVMVNLIVDLLYAAVDPRISYK